MSGKKTPMPKAAMRKALTEAMDKMNPLVVNVLATADPAYLDVRAAEAFADGNREVALVLVAWGLVSGHTSTDPLSS